MKTLSRGFTLIETLMAAAILATGGVAMSTLFVSSIRINVDNRERANATILAAEKIEQLRVAPSTPDGADLVSLPASSLMYQRKWQVSADAPRTFVVVVSAHNRELSRVTTVVGPKW